MTQDRVTLKAPAKINLFLKVTGRREDGYHTLETLMQKVGLCDELTLRLHGNKGIRLRCPGSTLAENSENLVYRAAELFLQTFGARLAGPLPGVEILLVKNIPIAAGLGGGSSDAAATLKGLARLFGSVCSGAELAALGLQLGADVPFFLADTPAAFASGIGELLTPVPSLTGYSVLLVNPGFPVSTRWVYQTFALTSRDIKDRLKNLRKDALGAGVPEGQTANGAFLAARCNDLEAVTVARYPEIELLKNELTAQGAATALMSGSGPTVFGLFADQRGAEVSYGIFKHRFKHTYLVSPFEGKG